VIKSKEQKAMSHEIRIFSVFAIILIFALSFAVTSEAKSKKLVANWQPEIFVYSESEAGDNTPKIDSEHLLSGSIDGIEVKKFIEDAITKKLHSLKITGKLPFELNETNEVNFSDLTGGRNDFSDDELSIGIVPIVTLDNAFTNK